eukprot:12165075-Heterocapsa_arctica.AAC.1
MLVKHRLMQKLDHIKQCLRVDLLPVPGGIVPGQARTIAQVKEDKAYAYRVDVIKRLLVCVHAAYAEFDSYTQQWGFSERVSTPTEETNMCPFIPAIIDEA